MATKTKTGLGLVCPFCGASDEAINLDLNGLDGITCGGCDREFTAEEAALEAAANARKWDAVARAIDAMADMVRKA